VVLPLALLATHATAIAPTSAAGVTFSQAAVRSAAAKHRAGIATHINGTSTFYMVNASNLVGGGKNTEILRVEIGASGGSTVNRVVTGIDPSFDEVSSSVVCGQKFYAVATQFPSALGLLVVDLQAKTHDLIGTVTENGDALLLHALACGDTDDTVRVVGSTFTSPRPTFSLRALNLSTSVAKLVGAFPGPDGKDAVQWGMGYDSIFRFDLAAAELWASFPIKDLFGNYNRGELLVLDVTTGALKSRKQFKGSPGEPYFQLPAKDDLTFKGVFIKNTGVMHFCTCDPSGQTITVSACVDAGAWWAVGRPPTSSSLGDIYIASQALRHGRTQPVHKVNQDTGDLIHVIDLVGEDEDYHIEAFASL
jgi:hypothetical protein